MDYRKLCPGCRFTFRVSMFYFTPLLGALNVFREYVSVLKSICMKFALIFVSTDGWIGLVLKIQINHFNHTDDFRKKGNY